MIEIENVSVKYRTENDIYTAIANVNLTVPDGGTCAVIGPSGCGKSTLLKCVAGLIPDYEGRVLINGEEVNPKTQTIGFMPQNYGLLPWKNVVDNICLGMKIKKAPELLDRNVIKRLMRQLGIEGLGHRYPVELSGGQHVNKTSSAIRITHFPTGVVVQCQNERSQIQNRETAMRMLRGKLLEIKERERMEHMADIKGEMKKIEWGSQIRSYVFQPYTMVKDHRTGEETGNIQAVMDGDIESFINAYLMKC